MFGYFAFARNRRADDRETSGHIVSISADVKYIREAIDELKDKQEALEQNYKDLLGRICRLEAKID
ncbi:hypothetical protein FACS1894133_7640 [Clostridia bacterium]|nr:hypothetical protein FACS1894133_7640 [Clostridia bacterium]